MERCRSSSVDANKARSFTNIMTSNCRFLSVGIYPCGYFYVNRESFRHLVVIFRQILRCNALKFTYMRNRVDIIIFTLNIRGA